MAKAAVFIIDGVEDLEAVTSIDLIRRGKIEVDVVSLEPELLVTASHGVKIKADKLLADISPDNYDMLVIPGGTLAYLDKKPFMEVIAKAGKEGKKIAALCIAPVVLGELGLLEGKRAVVYPGGENRLKGAKVEKVPVVTDGNITTSRGPATAPLFALEIVKILAGEEAANEVKKGVLLKDIDIIS
jgi:4-methyl-5(b-hydroxyethyl)-thiazole monophosphate biosynthesis